MRNEERGTNSNTNRKDLIGGIALLFASCAGAFIFYCEKLQLTPYTFKGLAARLGAVSLLFFLFFFLLYFLLRKTVLTLTKSEWLSFTIAGIALSVFAMVWFPIPDSGLFREHTLIIRVLPDETGEIRPVTLTWLHRQTGDIPLTEVQCTGNCAYDDNNPSISESDAEMRWTGKTGSSMTIEFKSGKDQGLAEVTWDGAKTTAALNNEEFYRLSFDYSFSPSDGLIEFAAVWLLVFLTCFAGCITAVRLLPGWNFRIFFGAAFIIFAAFRIIQFCTVSEPLGFIDSEFYIGQSRLTLADLLRGEKYCRIQEWHCLSRPLLIPLVYKACRQNNHTIVMVQLAVSILCWGYFAWHASHLCERNITQKLVLIFSLGLGCVPNVTRWDQMIMSESLSISASMLMMGSLFWLTRTGKEWHFLPALLTAVSALLFIYSRDSALWTVFFVIIMLLFIIRQRIGKRMILGLCAVLLIFSIQTIRTTGDRWVYSFENVLFNRIAKDPEALTFFIESGMPTPENIEHFYGAEHVMADPLFNSEQFKPLREWILSDGLKTYFRYLLLTPAATLRMTWYAGFEKEAYEKIEYTFAPRGFQKILPDAVIKLFSVNIPGALMTGLAIFAILTAFRVSNGERYAFPILFILSAYLLGTAAFLADEYELDRHIMTILIMMKASFPPLICMLSEDLLRQHR